ncbi:helix-turn-helix transcriptional regulator [Streptomyces subrutilus]|uniref:helix-turn-helix domain-containing protein n=1 Tax=Streptomyces subrutilus TaxID=36818 RepID=UPI0034061362
MGDVLGAPDRPRNTDDRHAPSDGGPEPSGERQGPSGGGPGAFPARLRPLRGERGLPLADLARLTHYSKGYLSKIETGAKRPTPDVARRCDEVLGAGGDPLRRVRRPGPDTGPPGPRPPGEGPYRPVPMARWRCAGCPTAARR